MTHRIGTAITIAITLMGLASSTNARQATAPQEMLSGNALVAALKKGGYVLVMRHTSSPRETPARGKAAADNTNLERQLDDAGKAEATAFGKAIRDLKISIGVVLSSPTYRALETVKFAQLPKAQPHAEIGDRGQSMQGVSDADGTWLRERAAATPESGNTVIVTHSPNISRAFPEITGVADGEALMFRPDGKGGSTLVARIKVGDWASLKP